MSDTSDPFIADVQHGIAVVRTVLGGDPERALSVAVAACVARSANADDPDEDGAPLWTLDRPGISPLRQAFHTIAGVARLSGHPGIADVASVREAEVERAVEAANQIIAAARILRSFLTAAGAAADAIESAVAGLTIPAAEEEASIVLVQDDVDDEVVEAMKSEIDGHVPMVAVAIDALREHADDRQASDDLARIAQSISVAAVAVDHRDVAQAAKAAEDAVRSGGLPGIVAAFDAILVAVGLPPQFAAADVPVAMVDVQPVSDGFMGFDAPTGSAAVDEVAALRADEMVAVFAEEFAVDHPRILALAEAAAGGDGAATVDLGRAWHKVKGSAAAVGLIGISLIGKHWEDALERAPDPAAVDPELIGAARRDAVVVAAAMGLAAAVDEVAALRADEMVAVFAEEFAVDHPRILALAEAAAAGGDGAATVDLGRAWHKVKGSAAAVGLIGISLIGKHWEDALERAPDPAAVDPELIGAARRDAVVVAAAMGLAAAPAAVAPVQEAPIAVAQVPAVHAAPSEAPAQPTDEVWDFEDSEPPQKASSADVLDFRAVFAAELERTMPVVTDILLRMAAGEAGVRGELVDITHRVKGSAITACPGPVADAAVDTWTASRDATVPPATLAGRFAVLAQAAGVPWAPPERIGAITQQVAEAGRRVQPQVQTASQPAAPAPVAVARVADDEIPAAVIEAFVEESSELVDEADRIATRIDDDGDPKSCLRDLMRVWHTIKGGAKAAGFTAFGTGLHALESGIDRWIEAAVLPPPSKLGAAIRAAHAVVASGYARVRMGRQAPDMTAEIADALRTAETVDAGHAAAAPVRDGTPASAGDAPGSKTGGSTMSGARPAAERRFVRVQVDTLDAVMGIAGELVTARSRFNSRIAAIRPHQQEMRDGHARLVRLVGGFHERNAFTLRRAGRGKDIGAFDDLELDRYDEINILSRQLAEIADDVAQAQSSIAGILESFADDNKSFVGLVSDLQGRVTAARMIPAQTLFDRLRMPIRDAASALNKDVAVAVAGGDVALDKATIEGLQPPLLHLVRNAVAHGIEPADVRRRAGKDPRGTVHITAAQDAGRIVITVRDDGGGLDLERMRRIGTERGLIKSDAGEDEVSALVFAAGFSTKDTVDEVSGRGVGGDVAKSGIERLGGRIQVRTERGVGTTFVVTMPLTVAITRALIVRDGGATYAIPSSFVSRVVSAADDPTVLSDGVVLQGPNGRIHVQPAPLGAILGGRPSKGVTVVVLRVGDAHAAVTLDAVVTQDDVVIKPMDGIIARNPAVSGLTVDADGRVIPVLDAPGIVGLRSRTDDDGRQVGRGRHVRDAATASDAAQGASDGRRTGIRVLFADDASSVRKVAEKFLGSLDGITAVFAVDGVDAFAKLAADPGGFDMVFTDLEMPRMNGFDLIRDLRRDARFKTLPVAVVTSRTGKKHRDEALRLGADEYIGKPFSKEILAGAIAKLTAGRVAEVARG